MLRFLGYFATAMEKLDNFHSPHVPPVMGTGLRESAGGGKSVSRKACLPLGPMV